jgi:tRNA splicing endonuclease
VIKVSIERHILYVKPGIIRICASYDSPQELVTVREEMERLGFKNIRLQTENKVNNMNLQKIEADYLYSRNKTALKEGKLDELRSWVD